MYIRVILFDKKCLDFNKIKTEELKSPQYVLFYHFFYTFLPLTISLKIARFKMKNHSIILIVRWGMEKEKVEILAKKRGETNERLISSRLSGDRSGFGNMCSAIEIH